MASSAPMWKSTGRWPIRSPPTRGTNASWLRASSGPSSRMGMRLSPVNSSGTLAPGLATGWMVMASPSISTPTPSEVRMSAVMPTSPTAGALVMVLGSVPSMAATMCLVTAFLDPLTLTCPTRGPFGRMCQASATGSTMASEGSGVAWDARTRPHAPRGGRAQASRPPRSHEGMVTVRVPSAEAVPAAGGVVSPGSAGRGSDLRSARARRSRDATCEVLGSEGETRETENAVGSGAGAQTWGLRGARRLTELSSRSVVIVGTSSVAVTCGTRVRLASGGGLAPAN